MSDDRANRLHELTESVKARNERIRQLRELKSIKEALDWAQAPTSYDDLAAQSGRLGEDDSAYSLAERVRALYSRERNEANRLRTRAMTAEAALQRLQLGFSEITDELSRAITEHRTAIRNAGSVKVQPGYEETAEAKHRADERLWAALEAAGVQPTEEGSSDGLSERDRKVAAHAIEEYLKARPRLPEAGTGAAYARLMKATREKLLAGVQPSGEGKR